MYAAHKRTFVPTYTYPHAHTHIDTHTYTHTFTHIHLATYIYVTLPQSNKRAM